MRQFPPAFNRPQLQGSIPRHRLPQMPPRAPWVDVSKFRATTSLVDLRVLATSLQYSVHSTSASVRFTNIELATMRTRLRALLTHLSSAVNSAAVTDEELAFLSKLKRELQL